MIWALALAVGAVTAAGVWLVLSRDLLRCVLGVSLLGAAANLALFSTGRLGGSPPVVPLGETALAATAANPLPQALVLTAIVIGFALTCFSLVLVIAIAERAATADAEQLRVAEPPPGPDGKPAPLDEARP